MPSAKVFFLLAVLGVTLHCQVLARPQKRSTKGSIRVVGDNGDFLPRTVIPTTYIEMKRTKLLRGQYSYTLGERITGNVAGINCSLETVAEVVFFRTIFSFLMSCVLLEFSFVFFQQ